MVPAQTLEGSDTDGCTPLRKASRKSQALRTVSGAARRRPRAEGVQAAKADGGGTRLFHSQRSVGPDFLVAQT